MNKKSKPRERSWKKLRTTVLLDHPRMRVLEDEVLLPSGFETSYLYFDTHGDGVTVICINEDKVLVQEEYSYPVDKTLLQFPGGKINNGEAVEDAAAREVVEESGIKVSHLRSLGWYYPNNRRTSAKMYVVLAESFSLVRKEGGDPEEDINSCWIAINQLDNLIRRGVITNYSILAAWTLYRAHTNQ